MTGKDYEGLLNRVSGVFEAIKHLPASVSDEDVEGLAHLVPSSLAATVKSALAPRTREASLAVLDSLVRWMEGFEKAKRDGKKIVLVAVTIPVEIIYCFKNAYPVANELISTLSGLVLEGQGDRYWDVAMGAGLPDTICSSSGIQIGANILHMDFQPVALVQGYPGGCDTNAKEHEFMARYLGIPHFILEKPADNSQRGREQYIEGMHALISDLEDLLGEKIDEERMREVAQNHNDMTETYWELYEMRKHSPCPVPNVSALYVVAIALSLWGQKEGVQAMQKLVDVSRQNLERGGYQEKVRSLWCWTGFYYDLWAFFNWLEDRGITYLGDALSLVYPNIIDTSSRDTIIEGFADFAWDFPMTRQMGSPSMSVQWIDDLAQTAREQNADCVFFGGHHSCKHVWSVFSIMRNELMKRNKLPVFVLEGDAWLRKLTPLDAVKEQIEEFVNNVVVKRKAAKQH